MKTITKYIALVILTVSCINSTRLRELPRTPKALDLSDHFGTEPVQNIYGPKAVLLARLAREGITGADTPITPILNFSQEINPLNVVGGDLDNTSYDASQIVTPEYASKLFLLIINIYRS